MYRSSKRILDIIIALAALIIFSPVFIIVILALLFTGEHEVFYRQKRIGYKCEPFFIWKFATMLKNSINMGTREFTLRNDPRVTTVGKILRYSKLNELPQIFNVLSGEMSVVGPRPLLEVSFKLYPEELRKKIYKNRPGITGIGSLVFRNEEEILSKAGDPRKAYSDIFPYKAELEAWYLKNQSLLTDIKIIFLTGFPFLIRDEKNLNFWFRGLPEKQSHFLQRI